MGSHPADPLWSRTSPCSRVAAQVLLEIVAASSHPATVHLASSGLLMITAALLPECKCKPLTAHRRVHHPNGGRADELKRKAAARELEIDSQWKDRLEEASRRFANERELLSNSWSSRLAAAQEEAAARYRALQVSNLQPSMYLSSLLQRLASATGLAKGV